MSLKCIFLTNKINEYMYLLSGILTFLSIYKGLRCALLTKQEWRIGAEDSNIEIVRLWVLQCPYSFISIQPLGRFSRNQSPVRRPIWPWYAAS